MFPVKNKQESSHIIHSDLLMAKELAYAPSGLTYTNLVKEEESREYGASTFEMNGKRIKFRVGKITPTKIGQFVTLWKRIGDGAILPHDLADASVLFVVSVRNAEYFGQFVFPKTILFAKGVVSKEGKGGKLAMRIYPPWDLAENTQAKKTQAWQLMCFFEIPPDGWIDTGRVKKLFQAS